MASLINPVDIDEKFPIAGQDNPSQGFRDNFSVIQQNLQYAKDEITELQNKALFKVPLGDTDLSNDLNGMEIISPLLLDVREKRIAIGAVTGVAQVDVSLASYYTIATAGNVNLEFESWPRAGNLSNVVVEITFTDPSHTVVLPEMVGSGESKYSKNGVRGLVGNTLKVGGIGTRKYRFSSHDQGVSIYMEDITGTGYSGVSSVVSGTDVDMSVSAYTIATNSVSTAVLGVGGEGEMKTFAMTNNNGNMYITVTSPGWLGEGVITFSQIGQGCTLQFLSGKWYCVGNNGCVFS